MSLTTVQPAMLTGTGKVVQVVNYTTSTTFSTSSSTYVSTGFGVSITPLFSNSKILILGRVPLGCPAGGNSVGAGVALYRGSTALYTLLHQQHQDGYYHLIG